MSDSDKKTLDYLSDLLNQQVVSPLNALQAAYQMGRIDGLLDMARITTKAMESA